ncbi:MAG: hypothetical protein ACI8Q1_003497 [Parvicella sp.]|jgi:hypothetical protein
MTGSVALDVVIGLVFIYLLYSLFATIIMEMISNWIGLRARNLKHSINRMLVDDQYKSQTAFWSLKIPAYFLGIYITIKDYFGVAGKSSEEKKLFFDFYNQPSIKYLSNGGLFSKPSYLTARNFSKALLDSLKNDQVGNNPLTKIQNGINALPSSSDTKAHIQSLLNDANNDLQKFKILIENWFEDTQERSIGWFKRNNQIWLLIIGLIMAVSFDANTLKMAKKLSYDKDARDQLVQMASDYVEKYPVLPNTPKDTLYEKNLEILIQQREDIRKQIDGAHAILGNEQAKFIGPWCMCFWTKLFDDFWGYALTALAISLGAPFWFDLLNKLVKLRGSVQQPARASQGNTKNTGSGQSILDVKA